MCSFSLSAWNSKINRKPSAFGRFGINTASSTPCKFIMIADYLLTYEIFVPLNSPFSPDVIRARFG